MYPKVWIKVGLVILGLGAVLALLAYDFSRDARYVQTPLITSPAPSFTLTLFDSKTVKLEDFRGQVVLVNFWASWCVPCQAEAMALENAWQKNENQGVVFLRINIRDKKADKRAFMKEFGISYLNGPDADGKSWLTTASEEFPKRSLSTGMKG